MDILGFLFLGLLAIIVTIFVVSLLWRILSRRQSLPCPSYLGWMVEIENPFVSISRSDSVISNTGMKEGMSVLDAGCGPGRITIPLAIKVGGCGHVVAFDIQQDMLSRVQKKAEGAGIKNIDFILGKFGENKFSFNKFDRAILVTVLGEIPNQSEAMLELFDSLKPGGILSVTEIIFDPHFQRRSVVRKLAIDVGFREKEIFGNAIAYTLNFEKPSIS